MYSSMPCFRARSASKLQKILVVWITKKARLMANFKFAQTRLRFAQSRRLGRIRRYRNRFMSLSGRSV